MTSFIMLRVQGKANMGARGPIWVHARAGMGSSVVPKASAIFRPILDPSLKDKPWYSRTRIKI